MSRKLIEKAESLLSEEKGTIFKDPGGRVNIALIYPNIYSVGMSSLGFQGIYGLLNSFHDVVCERSFLPEPHDIEEYSRTKSELFTLESKRPVSRFDIIAFSVSFENDYPNILKILKMSRIPVRSSERNEFHPLIVLGGVCAFYNPEPLAEFFDICFTGEAEEMLSEFLDVYRNSGKRELLLENASKIEGIYIPRYYSMQYSEDGRILRRNAMGKAPSIIRKRTVADISSSGIRSSIITPRTNFADMCLIEAMRGCYWSCRFCVAGHIYKPSRCKASDALNSEIQEALLKTRKVGLIGPSLSDYPRIEEVLSVEGVDFSITSLRASAKSAKIMEFMKNRKSVSIAPEAGTERLRRVINKKITEADILDTAGLILESDVETLRLYFMIGLPTETAEDINGIIHLTKKIRRQTKRGVITLSVSTFVPKPFTPFQWHPMEVLHEVKERLKLIKKGLVHEKGVKVLHDVPKYAYMQGTFSLGDRRVSEGIEELALSDHHSPKKLLNAYQDFTLFREKDFHEILPWDFIDAGIPKERLWEEYQKALGI